MRRVAIALVTCSILVNVAFAGINENAKIAVHVLPYNAKLTCTKNFPVINDCHDIISTYPGTNVHFFPVWFDVVEYLGVEYGFRWDGSTCTYTNCATFVIGDIVRPDSNGISHAWTTCQQGPVCIPGYGWIDSYGLIRIVPHDRMGGPNIADCQDPSFVDSIPPDAWGWAGTNGLMGCDPCELSVEPTTWGQIKALFR